MPRRTNRTTHLRDWPITVGAIALRGQGFALACEVCGHTAKWSAAALAAQAPPLRTAWDFKRAAAPVARRAARPKRFD